MPDNKLEVPVQVSVDAAPTAGTRSTEFYVTLVAKVCGILLGTGWVTGHNLAIQLGGVAMAIIAQLAYVYSRTRLKLAVLSPFARIDATAQQLDDGGMLDAIADLKKMLAPAAPPAPSPVVSDHPLTHEQVASWSTALTEHMKAAGLTSITNAQLAEAAKTNPRLDINNHHPG